MNSLYGKARESFLTGQLSWTSGSVRAALVTAAYVVDLENHRYLADIAEDAISAVSASLGGRTGDQGVADARDTVLRRVVGLPIVAIVLYKDSGVRATSHLIAYMDTAVGLPLTPAGKDVTVRWSNDVDRIFKL